LEETDPVISPEFLTDGYSKLNQSPLESLARDSWLDDSG
jgi:hypothetical protein